MRETVSNTSMAANWMSASFAVTWIQVSKTGANSDVERAAAKCEMSIGKTMTQDAVVGDARKWRSWRGSVIMTKEIIPRQFQVYLKVRVIPCRIISDGPFKINKNHASPSPAMMRSIRYYSTSSSYKYILTRKEGKVGIVQL